MLLLVGSDAGRLERLRSALRRHSFPCFSCLYTEIGDFPLWEEVDVVLFCQFPSAPLFRLYFAPIRAAHPEIKSVVWFDGSIEKEELSDCGLFDESVAFKPRHFTYFVEVMRKNYYIYPRYCKNRFYSRHALSDILYRTMIELDSMTPALSAFLALLIRYKDGVTIDVIRYSCFRDPKDITKNNVHNLVSRLNSELGYPAARWDAEESKYVLW